MGLGIRGMNGKGRERIKFLVKEMVPEPEEFLVAIQAMIREPFMEWMLIDKGFSDIFISQYKTIG